MKKLLMSVTLLISISSLASIDGLYQGNLSQAVGINSTRGDICSVKISNNKDGTVDVSLKTGDQTFSETSLEASFSGVNEYEPKYRISRSRSRSKDDTVVVFVDYKDKNRINSVSAYKINNSNFGYSYSISCEF